MPRTRALPVQREGSVMTRILAVCTAAFFGLLAAGPAPAHEGHDHEPTPPPARVVPRGEAASDAFELVAVAESNALAIYLDGFATNEPIGEAAVEIETPAGPATASFQGEGMFRLPAPWLAKAGRYDLIFTVTADGTVDVLPVTLEITEPSPAAGGNPGRGYGGQIALLVGAAMVGFFLSALVPALRRRPRATSAAALLATALFMSSTALAHEGEEHGSPAIPAPSGGRDLAQRLPDGSLFVPKATQRILAIRTAMTAEARFQRTVELPGRIIPDPNASSIVQASAGGR